MPTSEFEKKIHRWASLICCFGSYRCLVRVGSICNLLELDLQMPGQVWKHLQFAGIGFVDAWSGSEASATCWNWSCRCLAGVGSICNLLELDLQMPGRGRNHLQLAGIGFADAWLGLESSATCWNWICRCLARVGSICNLLKLELQMPDQGWNHLQFVGYEFADTYPGVGSICNLLELDLQMPGQGWKHLQLVGIGFADAYYQVDIKNPTTIEVGLFFYVEKEQNVLVDK